MGFLDDYEPVENRIRAFWSEHPEGRIITELVSHVDGDYIFKAKVWRSQQVGIANHDLVLDEPHATGYAHDSTAQLPQNMKASALEVCETSAIGRALANLGYAPKGQRPSREEMSKSSGAGVTQGRTTAPASSGDAGKASPDAEAAGQTSGGKRPAAPAPKSAPRQEATDEGDQAGVTAASTPSGSPSSHHGHEWIPSPTLTKFDVCSTCGETKRKGARL